MLKRFALADYLLELGREDSVKAIELFDVVPELRKVKAEPHKYKRTLFHRMVIAVDNFWFVPNKQPLVKAEYRVRRREDLKRITKTGELPEFHSKILEFEASKLKRYITECIEERNAWLNKHKTEPPH